MQIDHRTDIYSLGATFYELLTLRPIFSDDDQHAVLHRIFHEDPTPPRQIDRAIPVELETILLKTLAKAPEDRYANAGELAADLRRFLDERPILARRPSFADRVRKWLRRHPSAIATALVLLVFGLVALGISTALVVREQQRTSAAYQRELQRASEAEERFELARRSADEMIRIADEDLSDNPTQQLLRRRLLETALTFYRESIDLRGENPDAQAELAATRNRVQSILADLAVMQGAWRHLILRNPAVQDDLRLAPSQRESIRTILRDGAVEVPGPDGARMDPFDRMVRDVRAHDTAIRDVLTVAQSNRLTQIGVQLRGMQAFREPEVVAALGLSRSQREQIRRIEGPNFEEGPMRRGGGPGGPGGGPGGFGGFSGPGGGFGGFVRDERQAMAKILEALTESQRATWNDLIGPAFRGDPRDLRGGFGRGTKK